MPIEIRELHIKVSVDDSENNPSEVGDSSGSSEENLEEIVGICVDKVMEILKEKFER